MSKKLQGSIHLQNGTEIPFSAPSAKMALRKALKLLDLRTLTVKVFTKKAKGDSITLEGRTIFPPRHKRPEEQDMQLNHLRRERSRNFRPLAA